MYMNVNEAIDTLDPSVLEGLPLYIPCYGDPGQPDILIADRTFLSFIDGVWCRHCAGRSIRITSSSGLLVWIDLMDILS